MKRTDMTRMQVPRVAHRGRIKRVVLLRPGALGDVLVLRGVIRFFKDTFPWMEVVLAAPGERGRFLCRPGWADAALDWERAMFSWLFSPGAEAPPRELRAALGGADMFISYIDAGHGEHGESLPKRLVDLAPDALAMFNPSQPPTHEHMPIGEWMVRAVADFCGRAGLLAADSPVDVRPFCDARVALTALPPALLSGKSYAIIHPGSGSAKKNWPLPHFVELCRGLAALTVDSTKAPFQRLVVVSGEADGEAGERLAATVPDGILVHGEGLEALALLLANASLYVGNDSGVSHLASLVKNRDNCAPNQLVLFGPSDSSVWAPPGARVVQAREGLSNLFPEEVMQAVQVQLALN